MPVNVDEWSWWRECEWLPGHRWTPPQVHHLLVRLMEKHGTSFMTTENVLRVMDAKDPDALVRSWLGEEEEPTETQLTRRICTHPGCRKPRTSIGPAAKFCADHALASKRKANREAQRTFRKKVLVPRPPRAAN